MKTRITRRAIGRVRYTLTDRPGSDLESVCTVLVGLNLEALASAGCNDVKHFPPVDVVPMVIPAEDVETISTALVSIGTWEHDAKVMDLYHRLPHMQLQTEGAIQDRQ